VSITFLRANTVSQLRFATHLRQIVFSDCSECPGPTDSENTLEDVFTDNAIENITVKRWILTDRCELVTIVKSTEEFIESLLEKSLLLLRHSFTATQQTMFLKELKYNL
jgi:predicted metal-binding protein